MAAEMAGELDVFPRRHRRDSAKLAAQLDLRAVEFDQRRRKSFVPPREKFVEAETPKSQLDELLAGAVGRKAEAHATRRKRCERFRKDHFRRMPSLSRASREMDQFLGKVAQGETKDAIREVALCSKVEPVTFEQLCDALEAVDGTFERTILILAFGPTCRVGSSDHVADLPFLGGPAKGAASVLLEIAECGSRLIDLERDSNDATARAVSLAAMGDPDVSQANLDAYDCDARAKEVKHSGLIASKLVDAVADALVKPDFRGDLRDDDDDDDDDDEVVLSGACQRAAKDLKAVASEARARVARCAGNAQIASQCLDHNDFDDSREREWRNDNDALAQANHATFRDFLKAPADQSGFVPVASSTRIALTLAAIHRSQSHPPPTPSLTPIGTQNIIVNNNTTPS